MQLAELQDWSQVAYKLEKAGELEMWETLQRHAKGMPRQWRRRCPAPRCLRRIDLFWCAHHQRAFTELVACGVDFEKALMRMDALKAEETSS